LDGVMLKSQLMNDRDVRPSDCIADGLLRKYVKGIILWV